MEKLWYQVDSQESCITPCPYREDHFVGSGLCVSYCEYMNEEEYDDERMQGYVKCNGDTK